MLSGVVKTPCFVGFHVISINSGNMKLSADAFGDAKHAGMAVPVELKTTRDQYKEDSISLAFS